MNMDEPIVYPNYPKEIKTVSDVMDFIREDEVRYFADLCYKVKSNYGEEGLQVIVDHPVYFECLMRAIREEKRQ